MRQDRSRKTRSGCRDQVQFSDLKPVIEGRLRRRVAPKPPLDSYTFNRHFDAGKGTTPGYWR